MGLEFLANANLRQHNSMAVPAKARFLVAISNLDELSEALTYARLRNLTVLILGEGSNTVFTRDYNGLVILNQIKGLEVLEEKKDSVIIKVAGGENWHGFVNTCINKGWYGLENLALIPGLVGAAPIQNIGAYGVEVKDFIVSLEYIDIQSQQLISLEQNQCQFSYRDSVFKKALAGKTVIVAVNFQLSKIAQLQLAYPALAEELKGYSEPTPKHVFDAVCAIRERKLPLPRQIPNTGSFFKNPIVSANVYWELKADYPDIVSFPIGKKFKIAAAWMIERAGWKNKSIEQVSVYHGHALVVINPHGALGESVLKLAEAIQSDIKNKFQIDLEIEPQLI